MSALPSRRTRLVWHRRDLRLHDNPLYCCYRETADEDDDDDDVCVISLYVFDQREFALRPSCAAVPERWSTVGTGPFQAQALLEAVTDLRRNLERTGGRLLVRAGDPAAIVPEVARQIGANSLWYSELPGAYERATAAQIRVAVLKGSSQPNDDDDDDDDCCSVHSVCSCTLYHPDDLPTRAQDWQHLAHPKQQQSKKKKRNNNNMFHNVRSDPAGRQSAFAPPQQQPPNNLVQVSPERFRGMCTVMGDFCRAARAAARIRATLPAPTRLQSALPSAQEDVHDGQIPTLQDLFAPILLDISCCCCGDDDESCDDISILGLNAAVVRDIIRSVIVGQTTTATNSTTSQYGESAALRRLRQFVPAAAARADRSKADVGTDDSSKFSAHLALGTLSPRSVVEAAVAAQPKAGEQQHCQWLVRHLEMRDYFLFATFAWDRSLFRLAGPKLANKKPKHQQSVREWCSPIVNREIWQRWALGTTGLPLVDAAMIELRQTGYCSNRVRQNAASFLTKDLRIDWRLGAEWFQFLLVDHCAAANWGNWSYFAGVGSDPKNRHFRTVSQALRYDPDGTYVGKWLSSRYPSTATAQDDIEVLYRPWDFLDDWIVPVVDPNSQYTWQDLERLKTTGRLTEEKP